MQNPISADAEVVQKVRRLSKADLLAQAKQLVAEERRIQAEFLVYLDRIESSKLHLEMAYGSLHDFMTRELGFSEGAAQRRIQALYLMRAVPETR
jgi:hypothetical protein